MYLPIGIRQVQLGDVCDQGALDGVDQVGAVACHAQPGALRGTPRLIGPASSCAGLEIPLCRRRYGRLAAMIDHKRRGGVVTSCLKRARNSILCTRTAHMSDGLHCRPCHATARSLRPKLLAMFPPSQRQLPLQPPERPRLAARARAAPLVAHY